MKKYVKVTYEKGVFVKIIGLFAIVSVLYYLNNIWASIAGLAIATISGIVINRELIKGVFTEGKSFVLKHRPNKKK